MNIYDISDRCGVSIATVSRVLHGSDKVSERTRQKVLKAVSETGYTLSGRKKKAPTRTIGLLCTTLQNPRIASLVETITDLFNYKGYSLACFCCDYDIHKKMDAISQCIERKMDAVIIIGINFCEYNPADNHYLISAADKIPVVMINSPLDCSSIWNIECDETAAMTSICNRLVTSMDSQIMFLFSSMSPDNMRLLDVFRDVNQKNGINIPPENIKMCSNSYISSYTYVRDLLKSNHNIEGIITTDDIIAAGACKAALEHGMSIPDDIIITGNGNTMLCELLPHPFTTINCRDTDICKTTVNTILGIVGGSQPATHITIQAELNRIE